jgi:hypothetical protein
LDWETVEKFWFVGGHNNKGREEEGMRHYHYITLTKFWLAPWLPSGEEDN